MESGLVVERFESLVESLEVVFLLVEGWVSLLELMSTPPSLVFFPCPYSLSYSMTSIMKNKILKQHTIHFAFDGENDSGTYPVDEKAPNSQTPQQIRYIFCVTHPNLSNITN